jgi:hypothetical protein
MAEKIPRSSDVPNFDTYPSPPPEGQTGQSGVERSFVERSSLEQRAAELGAAAGKIAFIVRQTKANVEKLAQRPIYDRVSGLAENARVRAEHLRRLAEGRAQELTLTAREKTAELGRHVRKKSAELVRQAKSGYVRARYEAGKTVHEYPVHTAVAAGALGFLVGVGLRIRRARRAY